MLIFLSFIYLFFTSDCLANKDVLQRRPKVIVHFALDQVWQYFISESNLKRIEERLGHHGSLQLVCTASLLKLIPHAPLKHIPCLSVHATWWAEHGPAGTGWFAYTVRDQPTPTLDIKQAHAPPTGSLSLNAMPHWSKLHVLYLPYKCTMARSCFVFFFCPACKMVMPVHPDLWCVALSCDWWRPEYLKLNATIQIPVKTSKHTLLKGLGCTSFFRR